MVGELITGIILRSVEILSDSKFFQCSLGGVGPRWLVGVLSNGRTAVGINL